ncbi:DUF2169 family type VI secretion system accessory protein [Caballeronia glebae]|uniref:DUF2169 family type VI secretion system accessory protein n=1 Tax=Caballeronia glebae TaxID=1777143 RepID=UPI0038B7DDD8
MSCAAIVHNPTPFVADKFVLADLAGNDVVLTVVSATFEASSGTSLKVAEVQQPIALADAYFGDPRHSSVQVESQLGLMKPCVDVIVRGNVHAPRGAAASTVHFGIAVGRMRKHLIACGDRTWTIGAGGRTPSAPQPFIFMPVVFERAFGGADQSSCCQENPVGVGYRACRSSDPVIRTELPNIEYADSRMTRPSDTVRVAGTGSIARGWQPRLAYAGTFDAAWLDRKWPLLPDDFDARHYQAAPHDQQFPDLPGGERIALVNMTEDGAWHFDLPDVRLSTRYRFDAGHDAQPLRLDTVLIEPEHRRVVMIWKNLQKMSRKRGLLHDIIVFRTRTA